jgi:hypothetical protein
VIYFTQDLERHQIKIGFTSGDDAEVRRQALQTGNPSRLVVLFTMDGTRQDETNLHERFSASRECGEWFRPTPDLLQFIIREADFRGYASGQQAALEEIRALREAQVAREAAIANAWPLRIYLAGKISKSCWRHSIVADLRNALPDLVTCPTGGAEPIPEWPILRQAVFGEHHYVGPFFASCDHGCFHGEDSHGIGAQAELPHPVGHHGANLSASAVVVRRCMEAVSKADLIFAWIDCLDCYGTVTEIGHAHALGKRIWIAGPRPLRDMWFVYQTAEQLNLGCCHGPSELLKAWLEEVRPHHGSQPDPAD